MSDLYKAVCEDIEEYKDACAYLGITPPRDLDPYTKEAEQIVKEARQKGLYRSFDASYYL